MRNAVMACVYVFLFTQASEAQNAGRSSPAPRAETSKTEWKQEDWNPRPDTDDFIVPLPCKGALVLRRVSTGVAQASGPSLDDKLIKLGRSDDKSGYMDYFRSDYIAGPFIDASNRERFYYIGKYEITRQQYYAVMGDCAKAKALGQDGSLPINSISWFDAVDFTRRLSNWIYTNSVDALPSLGTQKPYFRLPTEAEWEFATRGGLAVSDTERTDSTFPMKGGINDYAWNGANDSADGKIQPIGSLEPNPLKLYDVLGNVEEIIFEPFRMNRVGRLHGQPGGFVTKGGSFETVQNEIRSASRNEFPFFSATAKGETRRDTFGFRVVLSASAVGDLSQATALQQAWLAARQMRSTPATDPSTLLQKLAQDSTDADTKAQLEDLKSIFSRELALRNEIESRVAKSLILSAAILRNRMQQSARITDNAYRQLNLAAGLPDNAKPGELSKADLMERFKNNINIGKKEIVEYGSVYNDLIGQLSADFPKDVRRIQYEALDTELARSGRENLRADAAAVLTTSNEVSEGILIESRAMMLKAIGGPRAWFD
jgi:hypothetical protein